MSRVWIFLLGVIALGVVFRWVELTEQSLWFDESGAVGMASVGGLFRVVQETASMSGGSERFQLLNLILINLWTSLFGLSEFSLRALPAFLGTLSLPVAYWAGKAFFSKTVSLWVTCFWAFSAYAIYYAQEVRPYSLLLLLLLVQIGCWGRLAHGSRYAWLLGLSSAFLFFASALSCFWIGFLGLFSWLMTPSFRRWFNCWYPTAICCFPIGLFYLWVTQQAVPGDPGASVPDLTQPVWMNAVFSLFGVGFGITFGASIEELRELGISALIHYWPFYICAGIIGLGLALCSLRRLAHLIFAEDQPDFRPLVLLLAGVGSFLVLIGFAVVTNFNLQPRHCFFWVPVLAVLCAWWSQGKALEKTMVSLLIGANLISFLSYRLDDRHSKDDYRGAAHLIERSDPERPVIMTGSSSLMRFYGVEAALETNQLGMPLKEYAAAHSGSEGFWIVLNRQFYSPWKTDRDLAEFLEPEYHIGATTKLKNMVVFEVVPRSESYGDH